MVNMSICQRILSKLKTRNRQEVDPFIQVIELNHRFLAQRTHLLSEREQVEFMKEKLLEENQRLKETADQAVDTERVSILEKKLFCAQEELTELHRKRGENAQQIIDQTLQFKEQDARFKTLEKELAQARDNLENSKEEVKRLRLRMSELESTNQLLKDEYQTLQLVLSSAERKLIDAQKENDTLVSQIMEFKERDVLRLNQENDKAMKMQQERIKKQLEEAVAETKSPSATMGSKTGGSGAFNFFRLPQGSLGKETLDSVICHSVRIPTRCFLRFEAHDGEVNAIKWSPHGLTLATGGSDRRVKIWDISKNIAEEKSQLKGNGAITSIDFEAGGSLILAASTDFASRVWSIDEQRLRHTLTGHSNKVLAAKFMGDHNKVISGSYDRTLKVRKKVFRGLLMCQSHP